MREHAAMFTPEEKREIINGRLAEICSAKGLTLDHRTRHLDDIFTQAFASADSHAASRQI
jgi:hypothetical protein